MCSLCHHNARNISSPSQLYDIKPYIIFVRHVMIFILTCTVPEYIWYISHTIPLILLIKLSLCFEIMNFIKSPQSLYSIIVVIVILNKNTGNRPILFGLVRCLQTCQYTWYGSEHHHVVMPPACIRYDMAYKEVSNAIKCGTMISILLNNVIWINEYGPHLELFTGPIHKWLLHIHNG